MSEFEKHLRDIAETCPDLRVAAAVRFADARARSEEIRIPNPDDAHALAHWAGQQVGIAALLPDKPINAIKELRAVGWEFGVLISLHQAKDAIDILRTEMAR